ncbi:tyrosine-type recombinase/integrase [Maribellus sp. YY47]|uniref:tyrosine-type recombinase/integrase n=1 Tax=Maribellus sp. YY47 TaxID=2929486 RepID=UPI0020009F0A|nr:tyrosine-type recombinase/integrase [Maribellus sp. YY47]MCK3684205.1 tyrosine-type recombinase/integrase [Maribellus sp. YY47]
MANKTELIRLPQIFNCSGRVSQKNKWFIEFYVRNPRNNKMVRFRKYQGINKHRTRVERQAAAEKMKHYWTEKLKEGWSPFNEGLVVYDDNLEFQTAIRNYRKLKAKNGTFRFYASKYINWKKAELEPASLSTYRSRLRIFDSWLEGVGMNEVDINYITNQIIVDFSWHIIDNVKLSRTTTQNYQNLLKEVFNFVCKERKGYSNPCFDLPMTRRVSDSPALPIQEIDIPILKKAILKSDPQLWLACQFIYYCFIRPRKELRFLRIGDIDLGRSVIRIKTENSKTDVARVVSIPEVFKEELLQNHRIDSYPKKYYVIGKKGRPGNDPVSYNNMSDRWVRIRRKLGMPEDYKMYSWKHTGNGRAAIAGIPLRDLQGQNGHSSVQMTERYLKNIIGERSEYIISDFPIL